MRQKTGFTLIELLIVIAIIAILALIAIPNFLEAQTRSKVSRAMADMRTLGTAIEAYAVDYSTLPLDADDAADFNPMTLSGSIPYEQKKWWFILTTPVAYITSIPYDPFHVTQHSSDMMTDILFPGKHPPYPYSYLTKGSYSGMTDTPAHQGHPQSWGITSLGPNLIFDQASRGGINDIYDPTNGTISRGDIVRYGGTPPQFR
ncbi:MAG: prepilin-type N-terminal cleavage/methylation domain-containing protein [Candidatus Sumerlaeota bacterium]|nr:prepilin-type N-terminal cleavage/methylation domain-containing protein [Candidatus Sumerlaeota bacterium]